MFKNIFMLHPYLGMQPRARAGGICCTISLPTNQNDLPFAVLPRMIKRFFNRFIGEEYEYADLVLLVDIFLCNSRASNTCLTLFQKFKKIVFLVVTRDFSTKVLKSLDFTGKIVYSMGCKATVRDVLLRLKNKWHSRGQRFDPAYLHQRKTVIRKGGTS